MTAKLVVIGTSAEIVAFSFPRQLLHDKSRPLPLREAGGEKLKDRARVLDKAIGRIDHDETASVEARRVAADANLEAQTRAARSAFPKAS